MAKRNPILMEQAPKPRRPSSHQPFGKVAALGMWAAGGLMFLGTLVDLGILWIAQYQANPQWEFVAIASTLEGLPRIALALAFFYAALYLRRSESLAAYRSLGVGLLLLGLAGTGLGLLALMDYLALANLVQGVPESLIRSTAMKSVALGGIFFVLLVPLGFLGLRRPKELKL